MNSTMFLVKESEKYDHNLCTFNLNGNSSVIEFATRNVENHRSVISHKDDKQTKCIALKAPLKSNHEPFSRY